MIERKTQEKTSFTLSDATAFGRKAIVMVFVGIISYLVLRMLFIAAVNYYKAMNPPPPPPPTVGFGRLPSVIFPEQLPTDWPDEFVLETARNRLPEFSDRAKVYQMEVRTANLLADEKVRAMANRYGFTSQPEMLDANNYRWSKYQPLEFIFEVNLITSNFSVESDYQIRPELISSKTLPDKHEAIQTVKSYLRRSDMLPADVATASGEVSYVRVLAGELMPAVSLSDASFIRVDLDRIPIDEIKMYNPNGASGLIRSLITGALDHDDSVVELQYHYQPIIYDPVHTYPLKPISQAWSEIQTKQGYLVSCDNLTKAVIREVSLGYFESFQDQDYMQPIYVFSGDDNFMAYVSAVDSKYIVK